MYVLAVVMCDVNMVENRSKRAVGLKTKNKRNVGDLQILVFFFKCRDREGGMGGHDAMELKEGAHVRAVC